MGLEPCIARPGQVIAGRYRLRAPLGRGAMGTVWRAEHLQLCAPVAVKFLDRAVARDPEMAQRFLREARAAAAVRCSSVVQIFDYGVESEEPFIVMELLLGESLAARLEARGTLSPSELDQLFQQVARAVSRAHELGVVHRDLTPNNIFFAREGQEEIAKVLDFGIAKCSSEALLEQPSATRSGIFMGTPHYMSPEQVRCTRDVDYATDLWALGVIAFECLTGRFPFVAHSAGDLVVQICTADALVPSEIADVPRGFDAWFRKAARKEQTERFRSVHEMAAALHAALVTAPVGGSWLARGVWGSASPLNWVMPLGYASALHWALPSTESARGRWVSDLDLPAVDALAGAVGQGRKALTAVRRGASWFEESLRQGVVVPLCVAGIAALGLAWFARPRTNGHAGGGAEMGLIERSVAPLAPAPRGERPSESASSREPSRQGRTEGERTEPRWIEGSTADFGAIESLLQHARGVDGVAVPAHAAHPPASTTSRGGDGTRAHTERKASRVSAAHAAPGLRAHAARPSPPVLPRSPTTEQH